MKRKVCVIGLVIACFMLCGFTVSYGNSNPHERVHIDLTYNGRTFRYIDECVEPTNHLVAEEIELRKINASLSEKMRLVDKCLSAGGDYEKSMLYAFPLLSKTVQHIVREVNSDPVDSEIYFNPNKTPMFRITREKVGYEITPETLYREIYQSFRRGIKAPLPIRPRIINPAVTSFDNARMTALRARFSTSYETSSPERKHNIAKALSKINGTVLPAGSEFSFNRTVGKRTGANGFSVAKIIVGGEYVDGVGGGVCQASTTLYNAALLADLAVTQARNHSLVPSYVPPSFDAMVNSGSSDLRFKNVKDTPVFIRAVANDTTATVEIYGTPLPYRITTESVTVSQSPPPPDHEEIDHHYQYFSPGSLSGTRMCIANGHGCLKSEGYLVYRNLSGKVIERKLIRKDTYGSSAGKVMIAP